MQIQDIIAALAYSGTVPMQALAAAAERKEEMIPAFIAEIDRFVASDVHSDEEIDTSPIFIILHLLGEWHAKAAYRSFCRFLLVEEDIVDRMLGDAQENLSAIAVALFDGDPHPMEEVILDPSAGQFFRSALFDTLVHLTVERAIDRDRVEAFVRSVHARLEPRFDNMVWDGWQNAVAVLALFDLAPLAREAITEERVPYFVTSVKNFDADLDYAATHPEAPISHGREIRTYVSALDVVQTFADIAAREEARRVKALIARANSHGAGGFSLPTPVHNPFKGVGRNEPCPCGSGRKFKKCCIGKQPA